MSDLGNKDIFARNLRTLVQRSGRSQTEICKALHFSPNTFSDWMCGRIYPRIDKLQKLADYFGVTKADLVEAPFAETRPYYLDEEVAAMAQTLFEDPEARVLFRATRKLSPDDMQTVKALIDRLTSDYKDD